MFQRFSFYGVFQDNNSKCFMPDELGDFIKVKGDYLYRPLNVDKKLMSKYRVRSLCRRIVLINNPSWFVTLTFNDPAARNDFKACMAAGSLFLRRCRDVGLKVLLLPEHKDNGPNSVGWHFHGFIFGRVPSNVLQVKRSVKTGKIISRYIAPLHKKQAVFTSSLWEGGINSLGWDFWTRLDLSPYDLIPVSKYVVKYVSKSFIEKTTNRNRYLRSRGLSDDYDLFLDRLFSN